MKQSLLRNQYILTRSGVFFSLPIRLAIRSVGADPRATRPWDNSCNVTWQMPRGVQGKWTESNIVSVLSLITVISNIIVRI